MGSEVRETSPPKGCGAEDLIAWGTSGLVFSDSQSNTVIKSPRSGDGWSIANIQIEKNIYDHFTKHGGHEGLLRYFGPFEDGIRLEYAGNHGLLPYLQKHKSVIGFEQRLRWCQEVSHTLSFIHSKKVIHGDLRCNNIFLDGTLHSKVADFGGSSLDGSELRIMVSASHRRHSGDLNSIEADLFALGSCIYEILTGQAPYAGCEEEEIETLFGKSKFPTTTHLGPIGNVIWNCWHGKYPSAKQVCADIAGLTLLSFPSFLATIVTASRSNQKIALS
jgi:serine/threonine protein kinase